MTDDLRVRRYDPRDADAVWTLNRWALATTDTDPDDIPGADDLRRIESAYLDEGGEFLVGVLPCGREGGAPGDRGGRADGDPDDAVPDPEGRTTPPRTFDGLLVATGGVLPNEAGHDDERTVPGAAELHRLRVAPSHQRAGYGRAIIADLERFAADAGFDAILATTATTQAAAVDFYPTVGYEVAGRSTAGRYELVHFEKPL
jgi:GNAT superfamily N-acetyltransferase